MHRIRDWLGAFWRVVLVPVGGLRTLLLAGLAAGLLSVDPPAARALGFGLGLAVAVLTFIHWYRKAAFPYLDIANLVKKAQQESLPAAITLLAFFAFQAAILVFILFVVVR